jgi:cytochrome c-type biogenesis protein CcmH
MEPEQVEGMVKSLQAKLQANPNDAAGWSILARTYSMVGRTADAVDAYAHAVSLNTGDAALLVDYADALAVKNGRSLEGEPLKLLNRALDMDPQNIKGLAMVGKNAYDQHDYATAVAKWDQVIRLSPGDNLFVQQIAKDLVTARERAGKLAAEPVRSDAAQKGGIQGVVTLAASLASKVSPEDIVFVTVRGVDGSRLPLAIVRKKVKDLPISFQVGVAPGKVHVTARITKTGNATPQGGDLTGQLESIEVGSTGLILEIKDTFHP